MNKISIDIESYSDVDLSKSGLYRYAESPNAKLLLFGYAVDGGEVQVVDVALGEEIPAEILSALSDEAIEKWCFNANFERIFLSIWLARNYPQYFASYSPTEDTAGNYLAPRGWYCSMVWSAYMGLPLSLKGVGQALKLEDQKMDEGKDLIRYFCTPCKPSKANGGRTRNLPKDAPKKWEMFKAYNKRDVEVEMAIQDRLRNYPVPDQVWDEYHLDQEINDRGILLDMNVAENAIDFDARIRAELTSSMQRITGLDNPNSVQQLRGWLEGRGVHTDSLDKKAVRELIKEAPSEEVKDALILRQQLAKSSVKKYQAMKACALSDGRARGMFQFYGASRSGRWSGRLIQLQNLRKNDMADLVGARELVRTGDYETLRLLYDDIPDTLSQLIRTAFIPRPGYKFIVSDFSAIEARVLSWLAGEDWRTEVFKNNGDIYCASASAMFGVPVVKHGVNGHLRQKGKVAELACIAEGQSVLTNHGLIPIERVTTDDLVWDGLEWVRHGGVVFRGERKVITYEGLTATPDHFVWIEGESRPVRFEYAAANGAHLLRTSGDELKKAQMPEAALRLSRVYDLRNAGSRHRYTVSGCLVHNCGYGGSVGALKAMGAGEMGLTDDELQQIVKDWRGANPHIVQLWWDIDRAVKTAVRDHVSMQVKGIGFECRSGMLFITLPSGRRLSYVKPRIEKNRFGGESVTYMGLGATKKWERIESYGPKFVENIVQAISRDILCYAMQTLSHHLIVGHVHDEVIIEAGQDVSVRSICDEMGRTPPWAEGLVLRADGYECEFYRKD